jgi:hypothetical protein
MLQNHLITNNNEDKNQILLKEKSKELIKKSFTKNNKAFKYWSLSSVSKKYNSIEIRCNQLTEFDS